MISYNKIDNSIQAYFGRWADNDDVFYYWYKVITQLQNYQKNYMV